MSHSLDFDVIVVGSGSAGLMAALTISAQAKVAVVTKGRLMDGCSRWAQGGIAAAMGEDDSPELHWQDTMEAGRGLSHAKAVEILVGEGPTRIRQLQEWGVHFDSENGQLSLGREAAHRRNRIVHAGGDATGLRVETVLAERLAKSGVTIFENTEITELRLDQAGRCCGVLATEPGLALVMELGAGAVVLASGGAARLWLNSTNPESATGDGVALGYRAGAEVAGMEFVQFHPTALGKVGAPRFLISEALRGEGATVLNREGRRFLFDTDGLGELAGRDVVAKAIYEEIQKRGEACVYLDARGLGAGGPMRFPSIARTLAEYGIEMEKDLIPIAPAAHYMIGGVRTDTNGATNVPGLFAAGEVASSGVHGANRLASNSLLEALVFGSRAGAAALDFARQGGRGDPGKIGEMGAGPRAFDAGAGWRRLGAALWAGAGVVRNKTGLKAALNECEEVGLGTLDWARLGRLRLRAAALTGQLVCRAALAREESRGCQQRNDFLQTDIQGRGDWVLQKDRGSWWESHEG